MVQFPSLRKYLELQHHKNEVDHISQNPKVNEVSHCIVDAYVLIILQNNLLTCL